jgi:endonuclease/exonuclease/phosphatase family metal-dependent hydrolase
MRIVLLLTISLSLLSSALATAADPVRLRVLCYNIHHAEGVDRQLDLDRIARVIKSVEPDLVALQEVDQNAARTRSIDQPAELARLTGMHVAFGPNIELQGGHYGNAVLSRFPIKSHKNHLLPNRDNGEQRGVLVTELQVDGLAEPLVLLATHLDHRPDHRERVASAQAINELVINESRPTLVAGDLNDVIESDTLKLLQTVWQPTNNDPLATIPVDNPTRQIDFILFKRQQSWTATTTRVLEEATASDHRAIFAELEFRPEQ